MVWTISYTETALKQLPKLDRPVARRLLDFMDERIAPLPDPRSQGKVLSGPTFATLWRYRVGVYRVVCEIQDASVVVPVVNIGHCREVDR